MFKQCNVQFVQEAYGEYAFEDFDEINSILV